jgi:dolichol-phosphate mannosyltransferase
MARPLVPVRDTTSGFFAMKRECIEKVELKPIGYKIYVFTDRQFGQSKLGGKVMLAYLVQLGSLYRERWPNIVRFIQFGLVGLLGAFVDAAVFNVAMWYVSLASLGHALGGFLSQSLSFLVAVFFNYVLNKRWTFHEQKAQASLPTFFGVCALGYLLRSAVFTLIINSEVWLGKTLGPVALANAALAAGIVVASFWNYFASKRWAFGIKDF